MKQANTIEEFRLSQLSPAGIIVMDIKQGNIDCGHNLFIPHRDNYYKLIAPTQGEFKLMVDFQEYSVHAPALILLLPGQVHHLTFITPPKGYFIGFDPSLITKEFSQVLMNWMTDPLLYQNETGIPSPVLKSIDLLHLILQDKQDAFISASAHAILTAILNLAVGFSQSRPAHKIGQINQSVKIEREFNHLLSIHYKSWKRPADYANALSISVSHLNDTLKETTGMPVSAHIQQQALLEAKRLLFFTDLSVKEIGYRLGYDDPNYFSRLFKKNEQATPLEFRQQFRD